MANKQLTAVDQWVAAKSVVNGDSFDASFDEECYQRLADRTEFLRNRGIISNTELGGSNGTWGTQTYGAAYNGVAGWDVLAAMASSLSGNGLKAGTIVQITACLYGKLSQAGQVLVRLARADNGGAYAMIGNAGAVFESTTNDQRVLCATFALASDLAACAFRVEALALNGSCALQLYTPSNMNVIVSRKTAP
jgi:hypothetical protein